MNQLSKVETPTLAEPKDNKTVAWDFPVGMNMVHMNHYKRKEEGSVSYELLRNFSVNYPVARACIDYIKTKAIKLEWAIVPANEDVNFNADDKRIDQVEEFFYHPMGKRSTYREYLEELVDDYLVIGSIAMERVKTLGGKFLGELRTVDSSTIRSLVDSEGRTPEPPDPAYVQVIRGRIVAKLTQDDLIFRNRNNRTNTQYGLSPIESVILQAESAIKQAKNSLAYFSDGTLPEGFGEMPDGWTTDQIKSFERYFNAMVAGNPLWQRKIKMVPSGFNFTQLKEPDKINFERFELWLMKQTCSVFGVPPSDIGFEQDVNRATSEVQAQKGQERAMRPIASFLEDIHTDIIQNDFGYKDLAFSYIDVDPVDRKTEAEVDKIRIESGVYSIDEVRAREGLEETGVGRYIAGKVTFIGENGMPVSESTETEKPEVETEPEEEPEEENDDMKENAYRHKIFTWRKQSLKAFKENRDFKKFESSILKDWMVEEIYSQLNQCKNKGDIYQVFSPYLNYTITNVKKIKDITDALEAIAKSTKNSI